jgi:hypothetical protein
MKKSHETVSRSPSRTTISVSLVLLGLFGGFAAGAAQADGRSNANASCRQDTKRVPVWPKGPKAAQLGARYETREVTVCDGQVMSRRSPDAAHQTSESGT